MPAIRAAAAGPRALRGDGQKTRAVARDLFDAAARHRTELVHAPFYGVRCVTLQTSAPTRSIHANCGRACGVGEAQTSPAHTDLPKQGSNLALTSVRKADVEGVLDAQDERDVPLRKRPHPGPADELPIGDQSSDGGLAKDGAEAGQKGAPLSRGGGPGSVENVPHHRNGNDGVDAPRRHRRAKVVVLTATLREASVTEVSTIGLDLAKNVFQAHGASASGAILFRKKLRRDQVLAFFAAQPRCLVAMEACASAHYWAREIAKLGHEVRLIAPAYVKPFVKRQKNNAADAEAICEAAQRPTMRFVAVKSEAKQASAVVFRTRDLLVGQRTQIINAIRGHLAEYGLIAPQGPSHVDQLIAQIEDPSSGIPDPARSCLAVLVETLRALQGKIAALDTEIAARAKRDDGARRLMSIPGIGPLIATAIEALAPPVETFRSGRDFAAWVGLTPLQRSTGAQERLGKISRMGERTLRRLLIIGASGVVRWARRKGVPAGSWLARMLARKPPMLVIVALANKMARIAWALIAKGGSYRAPAVAA